MLKFGDIALNFSFSFAQSDELTSSKNPSDSCLASSKSGSKPHEDTEQRKTAFIVEVDIINWRTMITRSTRSTPALAVAARVVDGTAMVSNQSHSSPSSRTALYRAALEKGLMEMLPQLRVVRCISACFRWIRFDSIHSILHFAFAALNSRATDAGQTISAQAKNQHIHAGEVHCLVYTTGYRYL